MRTRRAKFVLDECKAATTDTPPTQPEAQDLSRRCKLCQARPPPCSFRQHPGSPKIHSQGPCFPSRAHVFVLSSLSMSVGPCVSSLAVGTVEKLGGLAVLWGGHPRPPPLSALSRVSMLRVVLTPTHTPERKERRRRTDVASYLLFPPHLFLTFFGVRFVLLIESLLIEF